MLDGTKPEVLAIRLNASPAEGASPTRGLKNATSDRTFGVLFRLREH